MRDYVRLFILLIYLLILTGLISLNGPLLALAIPVVFYLASGLLFSPVDLQLEAERTVEPERILPGTPITVTLRVRNLGEAVEELFLEDQLPEGLEVTEGALSWLGSLAPGETAEFSYQVVGKRGQHRFSSVQAKAGDQLGILRTSRQVPAPGRILGQPPIPNVRHIPLRPRSTRVTAGAIRARQGGPGVEFYGVRDYQMGDPLRHVNWRLSAGQEDRLYVNEYEQERAAEIGLILDARSRANVTTREGSLFEPMVSAVAGLAQALLRQGNRVSLMVYGQYLDRVYPGYGKIQRERILNALSQAQPGESLVFDNLAHLPSRLLPLHAQIILISSLLPADLEVLTGLRARGYQMLVISPNPIDYQAGSLAETADSELALRAARLERELVFARLQHAGIQVIDWNVSTPLEQVLHPRLGNAPPWLAFQ